MISPTAQAAEIAEASLAAEGIASYYDKSRDRLMVGALGGVDGALDYGPMHYSGGTWHFDSHRFWWSDSYRRAVSKALHK